MLAISERGRGRIESAFAVLPCAVALLAVAGVRLAGALTLVWAVFGLPGFALLGGSRSGVGFALRVLCGLAGSSLGLFAAGLCGARLTAFTGLAVPVALALAVLAARRALGRDAGDGREHGAPRRAEDAVAVGALLVALSCVVLPALLGVGRLVDGAHRFLPFFCADLFKQAAYTGALASGTLPPTDPFSAGAELAYYWLAFVAPAAALELGGGAFRAIDVLCAHVLLTGALFVVLLFGVCRRAGASALGALGALVLGLVAPTLDGLAALLSSPWLTYGTLVQQVNQEALDLTDFFGAPAHLAASTLYRLCLYVPQHQLALALALGWLLLAGEPRSLPRSVARVALLVALPLASLLVAPPALFALALLRAYALRHCGAVDRRTRADLLTDLGSLALACVAVMAARMLAPAQELAPPAGSDEPLLRWAWFPLQLVTSFGGLGVLGVLGAWLSFKSDARPLERAAAAALLGGGVAVMGLVQAILPPSQLSVNLELKASFVVCIGAVVGTSVVVTHFGSLGRAARRVVFAAALLIVLGLPGVVHDQLFHSAYFFDPNARERQHVAVPRADLLALDWARRATPRHARFLQFARPSFLLGGDDTWVPIFAGRDVPVAARASRRNDAAFRLAARFFAASSAPDSWRALRELGADYVYLSATLDPRRYAEQVARLASAPDGFRRVYAGEGVSIWQVLPGPL